MSDLQALNSKLLSIGGRGVLHRTEFASELLTRGRPWIEPATLRFADPQASHHNAGETWLENQHLTLVTGFGLLEGKWWWPVSWLWTGQVVVDMCGIYWPHLYGYELTRFESFRFVSNMRRSEKLRSDPMRC